jgi:phosphatidylserine decarboxylase
MSMTLRALRTLVMQEDLNFLLTNRVPRIALTRAMGRFSRIRNRWVCRASIGVWRLFTDLDLSDAVPVEYRSLHECFTRELVPGARPFDPDPSVLASPSDGIVGEFGQVVDGRVFQAKGYPYTIEELFGPTQDTQPFRDGVFVTLRLTSAMYHRFHAPHDCTIEHVTYLSGDTWNVNPIALARVERLFCRNERSVLRARLRAGGHPIALVPVAAILVASIRLKFIDLRLHLRYLGPDEIGCKVPVVKGEELGGFEHGSTIIVFAPRGFEPCAGIGVGARIRAGQPLLRLPEPEVQGGAQDAAQPDTLPGESDARPSAQSGAQSGVSGPAG